MKLLLIPITAAVTFACTSSNIRPISNSEAANGAKPESVILHTTDNQPPANVSMWAQGGEAIDTKELDAAIRNAESITGDKKALGDAYFNRAVALTKARQYSAAIGDYRRAFKADSSNTEAKSWIDRITTIYASLGKEPPKEGEEPKPLPLQ